MWLFLIKREGLVFYSNEGGLSIHTPDNFSEYRDVKNKAKSNFFFEMLRKEKEKKDLAEIKRLFYVAMTRTEVKLILSGCFKTDDSDYDEISPENNNQLSYRTVDDFIKFIPSTEQKTISFFYLLGNALAKQNRSELEKLQLFFSEIPAIERKDLIRANGAKDKTIKEHSKYYKELEVKEFPTNDEASSSSAKGSIDQKEDKNFLFDRNEKPIQLGEIAHSMLEAELNNSEFDLSSFGLEESEKELLLKYKERFLSSELGKKALDSSYRKTEYGFITKYQGKKDSVPKITRGVIDLFFKYENVVYIVDYKTDKK